VDPSNASASSDQLGTQLESLRRDHENLLARNQRLAELLKCQPDKVEHEIRNILNELRLLRTLFESQEQK
jgi:hypothetical protein